MNNEDMELDSTENAIAMIKNLCIAYAGWSGGEGSLEHEVYLIASAKIAKAGKLFSLQRQADLLKSRPPMVHGWALKTGKKDE
jgi:hypothetical protein